jgi:hypothetical protein
VRRGIVPSAVALKHESVPPRGERSLPSRGVRGLRVGVAASDVDEIDRSRAGAVVTCAGCAEQEVIVSAASSVSEADGTGSQLVAGSGAGDVEAELPAAACPDCA